RLRPSRHFSPSSLSSPFILTDTFSSKSLMLLSICFSNPCYGDHGNLHSFPTRRSSDLRMGATVATVATVKMLPPKQPSLSSQPSRKGTEANEECADSLRPVRGAGGVSSWL